MEEFLHNINSMTPLGITGLALIILYIFIKQKQSFKNLEDNHLHELPEIIRTLQRIEEKLDLLDDIKESIAIIDVKLNGEKKR